MRFYYNGSSYDTASSGPGPYPLSTLKVAWPKTNSSITYTVKSATVVFITDFVGAWLDSNPMPWNTCTQDGTSFNLLRTDSAVFHMPVDYVEKISQSKMSNNYPFKGNYISNFFNIADQFAHVAPD